MNTHKFKQLDFSNQDIYLGIDVHKKQWNVTILLQDIAHKTFSQPPDTEKLYNYLSKNFPGGNYHSAYEAGFCGFWPHRQLKSLGIDSIVVNPSDIPTNDKERKQKEDKRDSRKLAKTLRSGDLEAIHVPESKTEHDRHLIRFRATLVKEHIRFKNRIKSILYYYGVAIPEEFSGSKKHWSKNFINWLRTIRLEEESVNYVIEGLTDQCEHLREKILDITRVIRKLARSGYYNENVDLLISIPGIGLLTAMTLLTELEDINRFENLDHLISYVGLIPTTNSTSDNERIGDITPRRNKSLRNLLIESAWVAVRSDPALMMKFNELCKRMKTNRAIIIIAKKLLNRIRYVLKNKKKYIKLTFI